MMIIKSRTKDGKKFRPSAWIEMIACNYATFSGGRIKWNDNIFPAFVSGEKCLCCTDALLRYDSEAEIFIRNFARENNLVLEE